MGLVLKTVFGIFWKAYTNRTMKLTDFIKKLQETGQITPIHALENMSKKLTSRVDAVFSGEWEYGDNGDVFIMHDDLPTGTMHGAVCLTTENEQPALFSLAFSDRNFQPGNKDIVFVDIETSNLSFGAGSFVFLIGLCYFSDNAIRTELLFIDHPGAEKALLEIFSSRISTFSVISSYNGKSFDLPFLRNRCLYHGTDPDFMEKAHIDLLHYARRLWKLRIESCKLSDVERSILKYQRKEAEVPGWLVPQIYFDFLSQKDPSLLKGVFSHNKDDVLSLAALFLFINRFLKQSKMSDEIDGKDYLSLAQVYEQKNEIAQAIVCYQLGLDQCKDSSILPHFLWRSGLLFKKIGDFPSAVSVWEKSAKANHIPSCIEMAMYHEHKARDPKVALLWTEKAHELINAKSQGDTVEFKKIANRLERLKRKISKNEKQTP